MLGAAMSAGAGGGLGGLLGQVGGVLSAPRRGLWDLLGLPEHGADLVSQGLGMERDSPLTQALGMGAEIAGDPLMWLGAGLGPLARMGGSAMLAGREAAPLADTAQAVRQAQPFGRFHGGVNSALGLDLPGSPTAEMLNPGRIPAAEFEMPMWVRTQRQEGAPYLETSMPGGQARLDLQGSYRVSRPAYDPLLEQAHAQMDQNAALGAMEDQAALERARLAQLKESLFEPVDWQARAAQNLGSAPSPRAETVGQLRILQDALQDAMGGSGATLADRATVSELGRALQGDPVRLSTAVAYNPEHIGTLAGLEAMGNAESVAGNFIPSDLLPDMESPLSRLLYQGGETHEAVPKVLRNVGESLGAYAHAERPSAPQQIAQMLAPHLAEARLGNPALQRAESLSRGLGGLYEGAGSPMQARQTIDMARAHGLPVDPAMAMQHYQTAAIPAVAEDAQRAARLSDYELARAAQMGQLQDVGLGLDGDFAPLGEGEAQRAQLLNALLERIGPDALHGVASAGRDSVRAVEAAMTGLQPQFVQAMGPEAYLRAAQNSLQQLPHAARFGTDSPAWPELVGLLGEQGTRRSLNVVDRLRSALPNPFLEEAALQEATRAAPGFSQLLEELLGQIAARHGIAR